MKQLTEERKAMTGAAYYQRALAGEPKIDDVISRARTARHPFASNAEAKHGPAEECHGSYGQRHGDAQ